MIPVGEMPNGRNSRQSVTNIGVPGVGSDGNIRSKAQRQVKKTALQCILALIYSFCLVALLNVQTEYTSPKTVRSSYSEIAMRGSDSAVTFLSGRNADSGHHQWLLASACRDRTRQRRSGCSVPEPPYKASIFTLQPDLTSVKNTPSNATV